MIISPSQIHASWLPYLKQEFQKEYMVQLNAFLKSEVTQHTIYPKTSDIFAGFNATTFENIKVVILGQDPYHGPKQAHGLCFSVQKNIPSPPSLVNIFQEIERDLGIPKPNHGCLSHWASQGVFLLNTILTVREAEPLSHSNQGWEIFTDKVIEILNTQYEHLIFVFWGKPAQKKAKMIDHNKHRVLTSAHPSPLSAYRGFKGCGHFSSINQQLLDWKKNTIDWSLP